MRRLIAKVLFSDKYGQICVIIECSSTWYSLDINWHDESSLCVDDSLAFLVNEHKDYGEFYKSITVDMCEKAIES